jgi:phosphoribosylglycinamide formyltransferase-1
LFTRIAVLASGGGTNLQALIDAWKTNQFPHAMLTLVASDQAEARALQRAQAAGISPLFVDPALFSDRAAYDQELLRQMQAQQIDLVCLAGFMRILSSVFVRQFPLRILNIHPALLPAFGGQGMYGHHVHEAVIRSGAKYSGCTVHFVDEGTDTGPIVLQSAVPVLDSDTPESLAERILIEEHRLFPRAVALFCEGRLRVEGRRVFIQEKI